MRMLELQRRLALQLNQFSRFLCLTVTTVAFCAALLLVITTTASGPAGGPSEAAVPERQIQAAGDPDLRYRPNAEEKKLLARAVYSEARGENHQGQVAVAAVILNRIDHPEFPDNIAGVIFQPQAFTAVYDGQFWLEPNDQAYRAVEEALAGRDPSAGAIYYYNPSTATSWWIFTRQTITRIGRHVFAV